MSNTPTSAPGTRGAALLVIHFAFAATCLTFAAVVFIITRSPQFADTTQPSGGRLGLILPAVLLLGAIAGWAMMAMPRLPLGWEITSAGMPIPQGAGAESAHRYIGRVLPRWLIGGAMIEAFSVSGVVVAVLRHPPLYAYAQFGFALLLFLALVPRLLQIVAVERAMVEAGRP
jgi:hypothetical protein